MSSVDVLIRERSVLFEMLLLGLPDMVGVSVIVMTFWYVFGTDLTFFELFELHYSWD